MRLRGLSRENAEQAIMILTGVFTLTVRRLKVNKGLNSTESQVMDM